ncbi:response regulator transcription factor [Dyadobacter sp. CY323]|uniref:response regulator n=1 Tax=Dyadobacter sp. CY323 TaxID=2907302 RepID=UPI001F45C160|nr:response regulator transcription factor [Dyadobacter sp. CY323]MCE6991365.1 response regulator transcription factor [Dyadobacter sp. CY323]
MSLRVLITDDHQILLDSLSLLISTIANVEIVGTLNDSRKVMEFLENQEVDVLVTDYNMPYLTGIDLTLKIREKFPTLRILMLTVSEEADTIRHAFQAGISGYVMKKANRAELEKAITTVAKGEKYFSEAVMKELLSPSNMASTTSDELPPEPVAVTARELEIIKLIAQELSTTEIAERLFISIGTVETHRHNILRKLNVKNAIGIIKYAMKYKLV